jgi:HAD superfamily hydrolase (TIGR01459 family)
MLRPAPAAAPIPVVQGLEALLDGCDGIILDVWGVVHGGVQPYPGVLDALSRLRARGLPVGLLSNAPRRHGPAAERLARLGVARDRYDVLVTSGELTRTWLADEGSGLGRRCLYVGPDADAELIQDMPIECVENVGEADFLLVTGFPDESLPVASFDPLLRPAAARGVTLVCANPDRHIRRQGAGLAPCAGAIAERYAGFGGPVVTFGKPDPAAFRACGRALDLPDDAEVLMVGDSLETDIKGALAAGMTAVLVTRGVHADELGVAPGEAPDPAAVAQLCAAYGLAPAAALPTLVW